MKTLWKSLLCLSILAAPVLAGALRLDVGNPATNQEALTKHAVLMAWTTACHSPEKTTIVATAEGVVNGMRKSIPLEVLSLSAPGTFAIAHEWPSQGIWAIEIVASNPEYKDYATSAVVPIQNNTAKLEAAKRYSHRATETDLSMSLN